MDMLPLFGRVAAVIAPVLLIALAGFVWARFDPKFKSRLIGDVSLHVGAPALLFATLLTTEIATEKLTISALAAFIYIIAIIALLVGGSVLLKVPLQPHTTGLSFGNWGNLGMPICLFAFGDEGLAIAATFFAVSIFLQFTLGWRLAAGSWPIGTILSQPLMWALISAVALKAAHIMPPKWVLDTAVLAGGAAIPCMLLALGGGIARMQPTGIPKGILLAGIRLLAGFAVGYALTLVLPFSEDMKAVVLVISLMPVAVFNYILAEKTGQDGPSVASYVVASTALGIIALPIALAILMPV